MITRLLIVDDFLRDPHQARRAALDGLKPPLPNKGNYPGIMTGVPLGFEGVTETVSRLMSMKLEPAKGTTHGHSRITLKQDKGRSGVHIDPCHCSGILYLSEDETCKGGTDFYRHRRTGLDCVPADQAELFKSGYKSREALIEDVINKDTAIATRWERIMRVPMKFNRLILFNPWQFHNAAPGFGDRPENGRLVSLMFFNRAAK
jgi:hypothetical protein